MGSDTQQQRQQQQQQQHRCSLSTVRWLFSRLLDVGFIFLAGWDVVSDFLVAIALLDQGFHIAFAAAITNLVVVHIIMVFAVVAQADKGKSRFSSFLMMYGICLGLLVPTLEAIHNLYDACRGSQQEAQPTVAPVTETPAQKPVQQPAPTASQPPPPHGGSGTAQGEALPAHDAASDKPAQAATAPALVDESGAASFVWQGPLAVAAGTGPQDAGSNSAPSVAAAVVSVGGTTADIDSRCLVEAAETRSYFARWVCLIHCLHLS